MGTKRIIYMIVIASIALTLAACNPFSFNNGNQPIEIFKGTNSLNMKFLKGLPPDEIYAPEPGDTTQFQVGIQVENVGAADIESGFVVLNVEQDYMHISGWDVDEEITPVGAAGQRILFNMPGKTQINPIGGRELFMVDLEVLQIDKQSTQHTSTVSFTACYDYELEYTDTVCIDTDIYNTKPTEKTCKAQDISVSGGQGGPVEVTQIEVQMVPSKEFLMPQFIIHIRNSGQGQVIDKKMSDKACSASPLSYDFFDVVYVDEVRFSTFTSKTNQIECYPEKIKLKNYEGKTRCTLNKGLLSTANTLSFTTPIYMKFSYGYTHSISKDVTIRNIQAD